MWIGVNSNKQPFRGSTAAGTSLCSKVNPFPYYSIQWLIWVINCSSPCKYILSWGYIFTLQSTVKCRDVFINNIINKLSCVCLMQHIEWWKSPQICNRWEQRVKQKSGPDHSWRKSHCLFRLLCWVCVHWVRFFTCSPTLTEHSLQCLLLYWSFSVVPQLHRLKASAKCTNANTYTVWRLVEELYCKSWW